MQKKDLIRQAVGFLKNPKIANQDKEKVNAFLKKKGLTDEDIQEAYKKLQEPENPEPPKISLIKPLNEATLSSPSSTKSLNHSGLTDLPYNELDQTTSILIANYNLLSSLSKAIGSLQDLKILNLSNNKFTDSGLPNELFDLPKLEQFYISNNALSSLQRFSRLYSLKSLNVSENQITQIPDEFVNLQKLEFFWIYSNKLSQLNPKILLLTNLKQIVTSIQVVFDNPLPVNLLKSSSQGLQFLKDQLSLEINRI